MILRRVFGQGGSNPEIEHFSLADNRTDQSPQAELRVTKPMKNEWRKDEADGKCGHLI
jgi:hypothetical protein